MNKRYMDVSSIYTTGTVPPSMSSGMVSTTAPSNHLEVRGSLKIKDQELVIKKQKMELEELIKKSIDDASSSIKKESEEINKK